MRIAVFGSSGMLGEQIINLAQEAGHIALPVKREECNFTSVRSVEHLLQVLEPDVIINCAGAVPNKSTDLLDMIGINAVFPHVLARAAEGTKIIHISTDCVFAGVGRYKYSVGDFPNAGDYYGRSKALGEVKAPNISNIRTSFIGKNHGFLAWLVSQNNSKIQGWKNAKWTGGTVEAVAAKLLDSLDKELKSIEHLATKESISKYDLAMLYIQRLGLNIEVEPSFTPYINRSLEFTMELEDVRS